jgi:Fur family transcriptional regulator, ferric uptake regulator
MVTAMGHGRGRLAPMDPDARLSASVEAMRRRGQRVTRARLAVMHALASLPDHPTAEQVVGAVERADSGVHRATVYRTLETLTGLGIVTHVHVGHGATAYHLAERSHVHGHCRSCGSVVDLPANVLDPVRAALLRDLGFELDAAHVALSGRCAQCRKMARESTLEDEIQEET